MKGCQIYGFTATISSLAEIWSLTAVSVDRLQSIMNPLNAQKRISKSQVLILESLCRGLKIILLSVKQYKLMFLPFHYRQMLSSF